MSIDGQASSNEKEQRISKELERAYADLRNDIARSGPGLVKVFRDQLELVLDALAPVQGPVAVPEDPDSARIKRCDTVELVKDVRHFGEHYPVGTKGTVESVYLDDERLYPYSVKMLADGLVIHFKRSEIRKAACALSR